MQFLKHTTVFYSYYYLFFSVKISIHPHIPNAILNAENTPPNIVPNVKESSVARSTEMKKLENQRDDIKNIIANTNH